MYQSQCFRRSEVPDRTILRRMFELRHQVFYETLGWDVNTIDGQEIDSYDTKLDPVYVLSTGGISQVYGCFRLLPTTGPYMLRDIFPELLRGEQIPTSQDIWEISRLATALTIEESGMDPQASLCAVTFGMFRQGFLYAEENGISEYIFTTSVAVERMLKRTGLQLRRFGDGKPVRIRGVLSIACWLPINSENRRVLCPEAFRLEKVA